ncbi:MAG: amino acid transporter [Cyanobacteria bacterium SZAS TMP-1]|nr:amino acid transporter [Cyanobacteria bacterium SZAS TMP-1]
MCLTGVDYFSTLGYQPGIAFLAAGVLSPIATAILVLLTLIGALPVYHQVARSSPYGQGSLAMLEELLPKWKGKTLVLILLGFAATDFIITITLSAADAAAHIVNNEMLSSILPFGQIILTVLLILILGGIFLLGFREAINVSLTLVTVYLLLNAIVVTKGTMVLFENPQFFANWTNALYTEHHSVIKMIGISCLLFPKLALGLSGFETGVAVMPLVKGDDTDTLLRPRGRVRNTRHLLTVAALIMSVFLIGSAMTTTLIIPRAEFAEGGQANGRALSYLCHHLLGHGLGTVYDLSSILILWFAGASAMAGLLNLVPRYLPRYGMAPEWARAMRPLVIFLTAVALAVTLIFKANVDAQGGAYATGVLVLITSAALAVTLKFWKHPYRRIMFALITLVFAYTTVVNIYERPDGLHIATFFIGAILLTSIVSRAMRSTELRVLQVDLDSTCQEFLEESKSHQIRLVAHRPGGTDYDQKETEACETHNLSHDHLLFLEVTLGDASEFNSERLKVEGERIGRYRVMRCTSPAIPNAIAAILLNIRDITGKQPHVYLGWTEGNPVLYVIKFIFLGEGETAPVTREILREVEPDPKKRPRVHVG